VESNGKTIHTNTPDLLKTIPVSKSDKKIFETNKGTIRILLKAKGIENGTVCMTQF